MADFETTANAAVTKLQEIDEMVTASQQKFMDAQEHLTQVDSEFHQISDELFETLDSFVSHVEQLRTQHTSEFQQLIEKIHSAKDNAISAKEKATTDFESIQESTAGLIENASQARQQMQQHVESMKTAVDSLGTVFDDSRQSITTAVLELDGEIGSAGTSLEEISNDVSEHADAFGKFVGTELVSKLRRRLLWFRNISRQCNPTWKASLPKCAIRSTSRPMEFWISSRRITWHRRLSW